MDEQRLKKIFHFSEDDLLANRRGQFSDNQSKRLSQAAKAEQSSARSSAAILFVVAAAGLAIGLTVGTIAPTLIGRTLILLAMGILWPSVWAGKGIKIILSARALQEPRLREVRGPVHIIRYDDGEYVLQGAGLDFDLDGNPSGVILEGNEYTIYYVEATEEILSIEPVNTSNQKLMMAE